MAFRLVFENVTSSKKLAEDTRTSIEFTTRWTTSPIKALIVGHFSCQSWGSRTRQPNCFVAVEGMVGDRFSESRVSAQIQCREALPLFSDQHTP